MSRILLLIVLTSTGCGYALYLVGGGVAHGIREEIKENDLAKAAKVPVYEVDDHGRRSQLVERVRCPGGDRSYKLLCLKHDDCYFENNEARIFRCQTRNCDPTPSELLRWCRGD